MHTPYKCLKCGLANSMGSTYCAACGALLSPHASPKVAAPLPARPAAAPTPPPAKPKTAAGSPVSIPAAVRPAHPSQPSLPPWFQKSFANIQQSFSLLVIAVSVGFFLLLSFLNIFGLVTWQSSLAVFGLSWDGVARRGLLFQLITAPLLHRSLIHIVFNMLTLYWLGPPVEMTLGRRRYMELCGLCALSGVLVFLLLSAWTPAIFLGSSSMIFGILVAMAMYHPKRTLLLYGIFPLDMKKAALLLGAIEMYLSIFPFPAGLPHLAHLAGALAAYIYVLSMRGQTAGWVPALRSGTTRFIALFVQRKP